MEDFVIETMRINDQLKAGSNGVEVLKKRDS